jgi:cytochrome c5
MKCKFLLVKSMSNYEISNNNKTSRIVLGSTVLVAFIVSALFISPSIAAPGARQIKLLSNNCLQCHANPESTAPLMGVAKDWKAVIEQGEDVTMKNLVLGIRGMPPLGYCSACSEQDLRELMRLVAGFPDK